jgi:cytochrome c biogenesis protein ResB
MKKPYLQSFIWRAVTNRTLSTIILIAVTAILLITSLLPNPAYMTDADIAKMQAMKPLLYAVGANYNSQKLATGYFFGFICVFLVISATLCSIDRVLSRRRDLGTPFAEPCLGGTNSEIKVVVAVNQHQVSSFVREWLKQRLFMASTRDDSSAGVVISQRGMLGFWGSILFHSVLITALLGLVVFYLGSTRGRLVFTEGQRYPLEMSRFIHMQKAPLWGLNLPKVDLELLEQRSLFAPDDPQTAIEHLARFRVYDVEKGSSYVQDVKINKPLKLGGVDYLLTNGGFSPRFLITRGDGAVAYDSFINLFEDGGTRDDFLATDDKLHLRVRFFPDFIQQLGKPSTKSLELKNPVLALTVVKNGREIFNDMAAIGESVKVDGYTIAIPEVRRWVQLEMAKEPGIGFFFIMCFFGIFGILVRVLDPDEQLVVVISSEEEEASTVRFVINSRHFSALLGEVADECVMAVTEWGNNKLGGKG